MTQELDETTQVAGFAPRSPWEAISTPSSPPALGFSRTGSDPQSADVQLAPEVEVGNVEYKLKLLSPTPERFTRLVTQLKWRLLAGSGQALYEIGVSDSGQLIGLSRKDLDESLDTLERMAGELGATMIIQKEITIPPSPLKLDILGHGQIEGAPRISRLVSPPAISNSDVSPLSLTDVESSNEDTNSREVLQQPNSVATTVVQSLLFASQQQSSPLPIIRDYPYGYNAWSFSRTPSSPHLSECSPLGTPASLPTFSEADSDVDDDAAFAFDLDISNFSKTATSVPASKIMVMVAGDDSTTTNFKENQRHHRQIKHKKPKLIQSPPIDPINKALQRCARRESRREQRRPELPAQDAVVNDSKHRGASEADGADLTDGTEGTREKDGEVKHLSLATTPRSVDSQLTLSDEFSEEHGAASPCPHVKAADDVSSPRLIAEALIVRKFTVEVEEAYLDLDKLRL